MSVILTDIYIKNLAPKKKQYEVFDKKISNFAVRISPGGTKSFILLYRTGRRSRRFTLGSYPALGLADARVNAKRALLEIMSGIDPQSEKLAKRARHSATLFSSLAHEYIEAHAKKTKSWPLTLRTLERDFIKQWGKLPVDQISKKQVHALLDELVARNGPTSANRAFAVVRKFFNWCVERDYLAVSPCSGVKTPCKSSSRDRVLSTDEILRIWHASDQVGWPFGAIVKLLMLTAQRRSEVAGMRWDQVDLDKEIWLQPAPMNKSGRLHVVPLSNLALEVLQSLPHVDSDLVFPARPRQGNGGATRPVSGYSKWKAKLDEVSGIRDWTLHDLRRTVATEMAFLGVATQTIELILNHSSRELSGVAGIYNRYQYLDERRKALDQWAQRLGAMIEAQGSIGGEQSSSMIKLKSVA